MTTLRNERIAHTLLWVVVLATAAWCVHAAPYWLNADSLSYLSIARLYAKGQFGKAVNTHWSPLFSWLLALCMRLHGEPLFWGRMFGALSIVWSSRLLKQIGQTLAMHRAVIFTVCVVSALVLLHPLIANFSPDVMLTPMLLYVVWFVLQPLETFDRRRCWQTGAVAALGYYTKHFEVAFFLGVLLVAGLVRFSRAPHPRTVAKNIVITAALFLCFITPWVLLLSVKHGSFTMSTAADFNLRLFGNPGTHAPTEQGLTALPYPEAYSYWDVPSQIRLPEFSWRTALSNRALVSYQRQRLWSNYDDAYGFLDYLLNYNFLLLMLAWLTVWYASRNASRSAYAHGVLLFALVWYVGLYALLVVDYRYMYFPLVLVVLATGKLLSGVTSRWQLRPFVWLLIGINFVYLFGGMSFNKLNDFYLQGRSQKARNERIAALIVPDSRCCGAYGNEMPCALMYLRDLRFYGKARFDTTVVASRRSLDAFNIRYVFAYAALPDSVQTGINTLVENDEGLWVYERIKNSR